MLLPGKCKPADSSTPGRPGGRAEQRSATPYLGRARQVKLPKVGLEPLLLQSAARLLKIAFGPVAHAQQQDGEKQCQGNESKDNFPTRFHDQYA
jgi:hypothetical protein